MTDLELIKRIAEIDKGKGWLESMNADKDIQRSKWEYNPLTDKSLLWDLMVKHAVNLEPNFDGGWLVGIVKTYGFNGSIDSYKAALSAGNDDDLPRAILECIVEAHG